MLRSTSISSLQVCKYSISETPVYLAITYLNVIQDQPPSMCCRKTWVCVVGSLILSKLDSSALVPLSHAKIGLAQLRKKSVIRHPLHGISEIIWPHGSVLMMWWVNHSSLKNLSAHDVVTNVLGSHFSYCLWIGIYMLVQIHFSTCWSNHLQVALRPWFTWWNELMIKRKLSSSASSAA